MAEVRTMEEGALRAVQASGVGATWATASAPASALFGFVKAFNYTSARTITTISDRGIPSHHKETDRAPIDITFQFLWTGRIPSAIQSSGASVSMWHLEYRASALEIGNGTTGDFQQVYGAALTQVRFNEATDGSTIDLTFRALGIGAFTGSGYLS